MTSFIPSADPSCELELMTVATAEILDPELASARPSSAWRVAWRRLTSRRVSILCLAVVVLYAVLALSSFTPYFVAKATEKVGDVYQAPSAASPSLWLGTNIQGQSVFWRILFGTRIALTIAVVATAIETVLGLLFGVLAGYFGGMD